MKLRSALLGAAGATLIAALAAHAQVPGVNSTLAAVFTLAYDNSTMKPTYSASVGGVTPAGAQTDLCFLRGSATKTVKVRRVFVSGLATAVQSQYAALVRRSTVDQGNGFNMAPVAYDTTNSLTNSTTNTATALADFYVTDPTLGTFAGTLADILVAFGNLTTGVGAPVTQIWGQLGSPVVLRGVLQSVAVNFMGTSIPGEQIGCTFEWTEE